MYPPVGWKNLASTKERTTDRGRILPAVRKVHPSAQESEIADTLLAYWLLETTPSRMVGLAWADDQGRWSYAVMSQVALKIGVQCSVYPMGDNRYRVLPCRADQTETIFRQLQAARARLKRLRPKDETGYETFFYEGDDGGWHVSFETTAGVVLNDFGPYQTYDEANKAVPSLIPQVTPPISLTG